jgi:type IV pilus assembly protein PilF
MCKHAQLMTVLLCSLALVACQSTSTVTKPLNERSKLAEINAELGGQYLSSGEYQIAMDKLKKAIELNPRSVDAHATLGLLYNALGQHDKAEESFKQALRIEPNNSAALNNFGQFLCQRGRYEEGQKTIMKAVENPLYRSAENAYYNAGVCAMTGGQLDQADTNFRKALELDPRLGPALLQMADLSLQQQHALQGRAYLQRFAAVSQPNARSLWLGVQIERQLGDRDAEASYGLQLEKNYPDSPQTKLLLESKPK